MAPLDRPLYKKFLVREGHLSAFPHYGDTFGIIFYNHHSTFCFLDQLVFAALPSFETSPIVPTQPYSELFSIAIKCR